LDSPTNDDTFESNSEPSNADTDLMDIFEKLFDNFFLIFNRQELTSQLLH